MPLSSDPKPVVGELRVDGLVFRVNPDGRSVALVGWCGELSDDVVVPARVASGSCSYEVTSIEGRSEDGVFSGSSVASLSLPSTVGCIFDGSLSGCPSLSRVLVSPENETYASFDGMLFSKDLASLLFVPEGKEGAARIPDQTASVPASAFSRCARLIRAEVGEGSVSYSSRNGILFTKDMKTVVSCPPSAGDAVVLSIEVDSIAPCAFAGCALESLTVLGDVRHIAPDAFEDASKESVVVLSVGDGYEDRKAVWEAAGFSGVVPSAEWGDEVECGESYPFADRGDSDLPSSSGFAFQLLDDYTLAVSWNGGDDVASVEIPASAEVGGVSYRVSAVCESGFSGLASLESIKFPVGLVSIGEAAFAGCFRLTSASLPDGLLEIGPRSFEATSLSEVCLPASVVSVGSCAFAACESLSCIVAFGSPDIADDAFGACSGTSIYCPVGSEGSWNSCLSDEDGRVLPFGVSLCSETLTLEVGQEADLLDGGEVLAPEPVEVSYSYAAQPLSVNAGGIVRGVAEGATEVAVVLSYRGEELVRASRAVEVPRDREAQKEPVVAMSNEDATLIPAVRMARSAAAPINVTAPVVVSFGGGSGYDVAHPARNVTSNGCFENKSDVPVVLESLACSDAGVEHVLEAMPGADALDTQALFSLYPSSDASKSVDFGYGASVSSAMPEQDWFVIAPSSSLECTYRLNLDNASVRADSADNGMAVKPLASVTYTFKRDGGEGSEDDGFYLKNLSTGAVYSASEVKAHANSISEYGEASPYYAMYSGYVADESEYECKTVWGGVSYDVRIIGINHDDLVKATDGRTKAGLTFQFVNLLDTTYSMNGSNTNAGGWGSSALRAKMNGGEIWDTVPLGLRSVIAPVKKSYGTSYASQSASVAACDDSLFILTYSEYVGSVFDGWSSYRWIFAEGSVYEYYQGKPIQNTGPNAALLKGKQTTASDSTSWWMRSVRPNFSGEFMGVYLNGDISLSGTRTATTPCGVCPCFCL